MHHMANQRSPLDPQQAWKKAETIGSSRGRFGEERMRPVKTPLEEQNPFQLLIDTLTTLPISPGRSGGSAMGFPRRLRPRSGLGPRPNSAPPRPVNAEAASSMAAKGWKDSMTAFNEAIKSGRLSIDEQAENYAGRYMYMGPNPEGTLDTFKHVDTRKYLP